MAKKKPPPKPRIKATKDQLAIALAGFVDAVECEWGGVTLSVDSAYYLDTGSYATDYQETAEAYVYACKVLGRKPNVEIRVAFHCGACDCTYDADDLHNSDTDPRCPDCNGPLQIIEQEEPV